MKTDRKKFIIAMRKRKRPYSEIAEALGITKQRVHQLYKNYVPTPESLKTQIKNRDENRCVICHGKKKLEVHHINGVKKDNSENNLVTLCRKCHMRIEKNDRKTIKKPEKNYHNEQRIQARRRGEIVPL